MRTVLAPYYFYNIIVPVGGIVPFIVFECDSYSAFIRFHSSILSAHEQKLSGLLTFRTGHPAKYPSP